jgi:hypothetical protein
MLFLPAVTSDAVNGGQKSQRWGGLKGQRKEKYV